MWRSKSLICCLDQVRKSRDTNEHTPAKRRLNAPLPLPFGNAPRFTIEIAARSLTFQHHIHTRKWGAVPNC